MLSSEQREAVDRGERLTQLSTTILPPNNGGLGFKTRPLDLTGDIIAYEEGELDEDAIIELFQHLVDTGLAWQLQGHYGRTAVAMLQAGLIHQPVEGEVNG